MIDVNEIIQNQDYKFTDDQLKKVVKHLNKLLNYTPRIGVFGKTGVGKSSLCNTLFGSDVCPVSDVKACTREPKDVLVKMQGDKGISLIDVPGVGEDKERDIEYSALYQSLLPELDVILWVLKADDRAFSVDIDFYNNVVKPHIEQGKPFLIVLNQEDKINHFVNGILKNPSQESSKR